MRLPDVQLSGIWIFGGGFLGISDGDTWVVVVVRIVFGGALPAMEGTVVESSRRVTTNAPKRKTRKKKKRTEDRLEDLLVDGNGSQTVSLKCL